MTITEVLYILVAVTGMLSMQYVFYLEKEYPDYDLKVLSPTRLFKPGVDKESVIQRRYVATVMLSTSSVIYLIHAVVDMVTK